MLNEHCIFCKIVKKETPAKILFEDNKVMAFEDINPQAPLHIVIIPKHHIEKLSEVSEEHASLLSRLIIAANLIAKERHVAESGYRIVINCNKDAGQIVFHLHLHLLAGRSMGWPPG